jgi:outer membrane lipoprotein carrier protein
MIIKVWNFFCNNYKRDKAENQDLIKLLKTTYNNRISKMKRNLFFIVLFFAFAGNGFAQYDSKALDILNAMSAKYKSIPSFKAKFTYTLNNVQEGLNEDFEGDITIKGDKYRLKMGGQEIINNGKTVWTYLPEENEVNIDNYDPKSGDITPTSIWNAYKKGYKYMFLEEKNEGGVVYEIVDLVPEDKNMQFFKIRLQIAKKERTLKNWTIFDKNGTKYIYSIKEFNPNIAVEDNFFTFDKSKYKGVEVIDLR